VFPFFLRRRLGRPDVSFSAIARLPAVPIHDFPFWNCLDSLPQVSGLVAAAISGGHFFFSPPACEEPVPPAITFCAGEGRGIAFDLGDFFYFPEMTALLFSRTFPLSSSLPILRAKQAAVLLVETSGLFRLTFCNKISPFVMISPQQGWFGSLSQTHLLEEPSFSRRFSA